MGRIAFACLLLCAGSAAGAATPTDFGVRVFGQQSAEPLASPAVLSRPVDSSRVDLAAIARIGGQWGRVTSTHRSVAHNRYVGGVVNSYHLSGQAIDIARRSGVSHWQVVTAYRNAGYAMIEALDEGDHTHLAFGSPHRYAPRPQLVLREVSGETQWRIIYAPRAR